MNIKGTNLIRIYTIIDLRYQNTIRHLTYGVFNRLHPILVGNSSILFLYDTKVFNVEKFLYFTNPFAPADS